MRKLISIIAASVMLVCMILPFAVSADGSVLWTEDFSSVKENDWIWDGDLFFIEGGKLEGWAEAVVHQSNFLEERGAPRRYKECAWKVECAGLEDGGNDSEDHWMGLWFADYISPSGSSDHDGQIVYVVAYHFDSKKVTLNASFDNAGEDYMPAGLDESKPVAEYVVPDSEAPELDSSGNSTFTLGMRVRNGVVSAYLNDKKCFDFNAYRGAVTCTQAASPVILWNGGCHCTFDNLVVATADYNLFNESAVPANNDPAPGKDQPIYDPDPIETETRIDTVIVTDYDEEGNVVTRVESEKSVVPAPNTGNGGGGRTATKTGDTIVVVIAVMVAAIGTALVVKKVCIK